jgi:GrpB-like predicted nucleotidyltransferase (UPF0157 family)
MIEPAEIDEPVELAPYDERWPAKFESEKNRIARALGALALAIEHIGSTAIPGMTAKPVIDIQAGFGEKFEPEIWVPALTPLGYESLGEAGVPERWYFRKRTARHLGERCARKNEPTARHSRERCARENEPTARHLGERCAPQEEPIAGANFNLHAVRFAGAHWRNNLLVRDYLRLNPLRAAEYMAAKQRALESSRMLKGYSDAKSEFVAAMIRRAADYFNSTTIVR